MASELFNNAKSIVVISLVVVGWLTAEECDIRLQEDITIWQVIHVPFGHNLGSHKTHHTTSNGF